MNFVHDHDRPARIGMPEAVLCDGKTDELLAEIASELCAAGEPVLFTRMSSERVEHLPTEARLRLDHDPLSRTAFLNGRCAPRDGHVAVVAAGTSDLPVATEAARTIEFSGYGAAPHFDVGVAGLWRLLDRIEEIRRADVVIVVAGNDAALLPVVGGLVPHPVIGVPTSVGYGVAEGGTTALHSMLASCAQGMVVTNVDNGFGAACAAVRMLQAAERVVAQ
ncbi:MAG TPA: nickel pincer cofactor biosynthesis protein LarB [Nitriliruptorales bacterium]